MVVAGVGLGGWQVVVVCLACGGGGCAVCRWRCGFGLRGSCLLGLRVGVCGGGGASLAWCWSRPRVGCVCGRLAGCGWRRWWVCLVSVGCGCWGVGRRVAVFLIALGCRWWCGGSVGLSWLGLPLASCRSSLGPAGGFAGLGLGLSFFLFGWGLVVVGLGWSFTSLLVPVWGDAVWSAGCAGCGWRCHVSVGWGR